MTHHSPRQRYSSLRPTIVLILCLCVFIPSLPTTASTSSLYKAVTKVPAIVVESPARAGEVLVGFRGGVGQQQKDQILATHGMRTKRRLRGDSGMERLELLSGQTPQAAAIQLMLEPQVEFAEPNYLISHDQFGSPDDPEFAN